MNAARPPLTLTVLLIAASAGLMLVPAIEALASHEAHLAQGFLASAVLLALLAGCLWLTGPTTRRKAPLHRELRGYILAYLYLPPLLAIPFHWGAPESSFLDAWWEMVSCLTTTGASLSDLAGLPHPLQLWRGLVGWAGGFLILVAGAAILAPLHIGGFEVLSPASIGRPQHRLQTRAEADQAQLLRHAKAIAAPYLTITVALWAALHAAGDPSLVAVMHAMAAMSTSGISPLESLADAQSGRMGEILLLLAMGLSLSRRLLPVPRQLPTRAELLQDAELHTGVVILTATVVLLLFVQLRLEGQAFQIEVLWGTLFTALSFMTTTGFSSGDWSLLAAPDQFEAAGLVLLGLAMVGGGVATTAGGVTLLRIYALGSLCKREMERLSEPNAVAGGGAHARQLRSEGAAVAFVFFVLFALSLGLCNAVLTALGLPFEQALVFSVSALTTTGHAAEASGIPNVDWHSLPDAAKLTVALTMIVGRLETLAILALFMPQGWKEAFGADNPPTDRRLL